MAETMFDRAERGLGSSDLSIPDIVAQTKGNPQQIMQMVMSGTINVTQGLLAKRLSDSVIAERAQAQAQSPSVLQEAFPEMAQMAGGLGGMPQAAPQAVASPSSPAPAGMQPPMEGGLGGMPLPDSMFAGGEVGGLGSYAAGDVVEEETVVDEFKPAELDFGEMLTAVRGLAPRKTEALTAYKEKVGTPIDTEAERKEAEKVALFNTLANIKPGTNPFQAFVQGMAGTGQELAQSKKDIKKREIEQLKAVAEIEGMENELTQKDYSLALQYKQYKEGRLDKAQELKFEDKWKKLDNETRIMLEKMSNATQLQAARIQAGATVAAARARASDNPAYKISTVRPVLSDLRKQAEALVRKHPRGIEMAAGRDPRSQRNFKEMVDLTTATLAEQQLGAQYPELADVIIDMVGGRTAREAQLEARAGRAAPSVGGGADNDPLGLR